MSDISPEDRAIRKALQFSTRSLFIGMTLCALLALVFLRFGAVWGTAILWFLIMAAAHVAANAFGSHHSPPGMRRQRPIANLSAAPALDASACCAPATQLRDTRGFGRRLLLIIALCAMTGLLLGTAALVLILPANLPGIILGGVSSGILGGFLGFVVGSFVMVATRSFREAVGHTSDHRATSQSSRRSP
jgi:hypothetical protein